MLELSGLPLKAEDRDENYPLVIMGGPAPWVNPEAVAPFKVVLLNLKQGGAETDAACERLYRALSAEGIDVLYDDLDQRPGAKFATADLIGIPWQVLVGPKGLAEGKVELKKRADGSRELMTEADVRQRLAG